MDAFALDVSLLACAAVTQGSVLQELRCLPSVSQQSEQSQRQREAFTGT